MVHFLRYQTILIVLFILAGHAVMARQQADSMAISDSSVHKQTGIETPDSIKRAGLNFSDSLGVKPDTSFVSVNKRNEAELADSSIYNLFGSAFSADDSTIVRSWQYNPDIHRIDLQPFDSTMDEFHIYQPPYQNSINNDYLGNPGSAANSNLFFEPNPSNPFIFGRAFSPYMYFANRVEYYNVRKPFTLFNYYGGPKDEQNVRILHTQNVNPYTNVAVRINTSSGKGQYIRQDYKDHDGFLSGSFIRDRFSSYLGYTFNKFDVFENGGVIDPHFITDTTMSPSEVGTRLSNGSTYIKDRQWFFDQKIGLIKTQKPDSGQTGGYWFSIQYSFNQQKSYKIYKDDSTGFYNSFTSQYSNLYQNNYNNAAATFDSCFYLDRNHLFRLNLEEVPGKFPGLGAYAGAGINSNHYGFYNKDTLFNNSKDTAISSSYFEAGVFRLQANLIRFEGYYRQFVKGYNAGDFMMNGALYQKFGNGKYKTEFAANASISMETPDYFLTRYRSNHYRWDNHFSRTKESRLGVSFNLPNLRTAVGARYALLNSFIYFDESATPVQANKTFSVFDAYLNNRLSLWRFGIISKINYQKTGNKNILPLPEFSAYESLFYEQELYFKDTKGRMNIQIGADMYYWTSFYAQAYSPATAQFYNQQNQLIGNYPFVGIFANLRIKRMRMFFKAEHANYQVMGKNNRNYFTAPNYPVPKMTIKYGISWSFYN